MKKLRYFSYSVLVVFSDFATARHLVGVPLFLYASLHQYKSHVIFANLRKTKKGNFI